MEMDTEGLHFPPPAISRGGVKAVLDFLRRADRAWAGGPLDLRGVDLPAFPLELVELFPLVEALWVSGNSRLTELPPELSALSRLTDLRFDPATLASPAPVLAVFGVWGLGFGVWGLGFGVWGLEFGVWSLRFRV